MTQPLAVDVETAAQLTSLSRYTIRAYIRKGRIRAVHVGRRVLVPMAELERLVRPDPATDDAAAQSTPSLAEQHA